MYFRSTGLMTRDELETYVGVLQREIVGQMEEINTLRRPNKFFVGAEREFINEEELKEWLPKLSVKQITTFRELNTCFAVKINKDRIDQFKEKSHAEAAAMLHSPG